MSVRSRLRRLERQAGERRQPKEGEDPTELELAGIIARGAGLKPDQVLAMTDGELKALFRSGVLKRLTDAELDRIIAAGGGQIPHEVAVMGPLDMTDEDLDALIGGPLDRESGSE